MSQYPVVHCSFPPRLRRLVHENLALLRFSVSLRFYIFNLSRKQNHVFVQRNPICKYFCLREEGEFFAFYNMGALKKAKKREKMPLKTRKRLNGGVALKSQKFAGNSLPRISRAIILRVPKRRFWESALNLANAFAFCGKGEPRD